MTSIPPPKGIDFKDTSSVEKNWKSFRAQWENYEIATGLSEKDEKVRLATFLCTIGPQGLEKYENFRFEDEAHK